VTGGRAGLIQKREREQRKAKKLESRKEVLAVVFRREKGEELLRRGLASTGSLMKKVTSLADRWGR